MKLMYQSSAIILFIKHTNIQFYMYETEPQTTLGMIGMEAH